MTQFQVSLLRGINVGGNNRVAMPTVRRIYEQLGCTNVMTYVQSGNVILAADVDPDTLSPRVEAAIKLELGLAIRVIGRTRAELDRIVGADPYPRAEPTHHHVVFLSAPPLPQGLAALTEAAADGESFKVIDRDIHLYLPAGIGRAKLGQALIERRLGVIGTARNWRTVQQLHALCRPSATTMTG